MLHAVDTAALDDIVHPTQEGCQAVRKFKNNIILTGTVASISACSRPWTWHHARHHTLDWDGHFPSPLVRDFEDDIMHDIIQLTGTVPFHLHLHLSRHSREERCCTALQEPRPWIDDFHELAGRRPTVESIPCGWREANQNQSCRTRRQANIARNPPMLSMLPLSETMSKQAARKKKDVRNPYLRPTHILLVSFSPDQLVFCNSNMIYSSLLHLLSTDTGKFSAAMESLIEGPRRIERKREPLITGGKHFSRSTHNYVHPAPSPTDTGNGLVRPVDIRVLLICTVLRMYEVIMRLHAGPLTTSVRYACLFLSPLLPTPSSSLNLADRTKIQLVTVKLERSRHVIPFDHSKSRGAGPEWLRRSIFRCGRVGWEVLHALRPEKFFVSGVKGKIRWRETAIGGALWIPLKPTQVAM